MKRSLVVGTVLFAGALAAGCSSSAPSGVTSTHTSTSGAVTTTRTGTFTIHGDTTSTAQIRSNVTHIPVITSGVVKAQHDNFPLGNSKSNKGTFKFQSGTLAVTHNKGVTHQKFSKAACSFTETNTGTYKVLGSTSTGAFKGATGHGNYMVTFYGKFKVVSGKCHAGQKAEPVSGKATFRATGPLTVRV